MFVIFLALFAVLLTVHALADFPLQGDFLSQAKNCTSPLPGVPWQLALAAHAVIHGGLVMITVGIFTVLLALFAGDGSIAVERTLHLAMAVGWGEALIHAATDYGKCRGRLNFVQDQAIHIACKAAWAGFAVLQVYAAR